MSGAISFKAGKLIREGKMLKPDERKGLVTIGEQEDGLLHFKWYSDRAGREVEEDVSTVRGARCRCPLTSDPLLFSSSCSQETPSWKRSPRQAKIAACTFCDLKATHRGTFSGCRSQRMRTLL